jgi:L-amino acid N-acyltransferase YncA
VVAIRDARGADAPAIAAIYNEGIEERTATFETTIRTPADIRDWLAAAERLPVLVAAEDGTVRGWARVAPYSKRPAYGGVGEVSVYVERAARGRGIARTLLASVADRAQELGYWKLTGKLFTDNAASAALVRRCGWREVGTHLRHGRLDGRWRDVVVVELLLGEASEDRQARGTPSRRSRAKLVREAPAG